ncbi:MAG: hypothetical protein CMH46_16720 [Muricauda sp.]|nr:hypothetical protein [Allomuricauda sp.]|tara:strand:+ start:99329 stop:99535 length:207 start_codon:yes stop_codon:yes gene_type:complete
MNGHIHRNIGNGTIMLCNQLGYVHMNEHHDFSGDTYFDPKTHKYNISKLIQSIKNSPFVNANLKSIQQ